MELLNPLVTAIAAAGMIRVLWSVRSELSELRGEFREWRIQVEARLKKGGL